MTRNIDGGDSRWKDKLSLIYFSANSEAALPARVLSLYFVLFYI